MSWDDLETPAAQAPGKEYEALQAQVVRALDANPEFEKMLRRAVMLNTYQPGATLDQVAFREGQRAFARTILQLGVRFDEQES
jgi:hypothetical protein